MAYKGPNKDKIGKVKRNTSGKSNTSGGGMSKGSTSKRGSADIAGFSAKSKPAGHSASQARKAAGLTRK